MLLGEGFADDTQRWLVNTGRFGTERMLTPDKLWPGGNRLGAVCVVRASGEQFTTKVDRFFRWATWQVIGVANDTRGVAV